MIITIGRKPFSSSVCDNTRENQCGGINIDACRIICGDETFNENPKPLYVPSYNNKVYGKGMGGGDWENRNGRFPSNFFVSLSTAKLFPHTETHAGTYRKESHCIGTSFTVTRPKGVVTSEGNSGSASRYFKMVEEE